MVRCTPSTGTSSRCFDCPLASSTGCLLSCSYLSLLVASCLGLFRFLLFSLCEFLVVALCCGLFASADVCRLFGLRRTNTAAERRGRFFSPVLCWLCSARTALVSALAGVQGRKDYSATCLASYAACVWHACAVQATTVRLVVQRTYWLALSKLVQVLFSLICGARCHCASSRARAACGQSVYSQQVKHVLYVFTRGRSSRVVSTGNWHSLGFFSSRPWRAGRPRSAQAFCSAQFFEHDVHKWYGWAMVA